MRIKTLETQMKLLWPEFINGFAKKLKNKL
jgi:hypothetical protein